MNFSKLLINWYLLNKRDLPWRKTTNPYHILLSEIILQQTRVAQGLPYYYSFIEKYPTLNDFALADEESILKTWQGLGYYSRARNLHSAIQTIVYEYNSVFPSSYTELLKLKGVGQYTAVAIASFCYNEPIAVVDGNVQRVLSRVFGIDADISASSTRNIFQEKANELLPKKQAAQFNQAIMEFGALQCVPKNPNCKSCIFNSNCVAFNTQKVHELPVKTKKIVVKKRYINYLFIVDMDNNTILQKREGKGIWQNLYEFPNIETQNPIPDREILQTITKNYAQFSIEKITLYDHKPVHKLTHQELHIQFWKVQLNSILDNKLNISDLKTFPFPIVLANFIDNTIFD